MLIDTEFIKLPLRLDATRLAEEVAQFDEDDWRAHPTGFPGNTAISLISVHGDPGNDKTAGPMRPTEMLRRCPYIQQVLASMGTVWGRTRLMRIAGESDVLPHADISYYWFNHLRVHVPAVTYPEVRFTCGKRTVHMAAGEVWVFNSWQMHNVINSATSPRIHLVADTVGSAPFWEMVDRGDRPFDPRPELALPARDLPFHPGKPVQLAFESFNSPVVMSPWEQRGLIEMLMAELEEAHPDQTETLAPVAGALLSFNRQWRALWARFGEEPEGFVAFNQLLQNLDAQLTPLAGKLSFPNEQDMVKIFRNVLLVPAMNPKLAAASAGRAHAAPAMDEKKKPQAAT